MDSLTDEQKRRIEENRQKALAIRAAKQASASSTSVVNGSKPSNLGTNFPSSTNVNSSAKSFVKQPTNSSGQIQNTNKLAISTSSFYSKPAAPVTVSCSLSSKDRFTVEFRYNKTIIEVLKSMPGKQYDPESTRWNFPLSEYSKLKSSLREIKDVTVAFMPLPNFILKVFLNLQSQVDYRTIDLSSIDFTLVSNLYPFQREGVQFGISKKGRCIIADDMGLGKTIQALGIAHYFHSDWPLLVVCPSSMRYQWQQEIVNYLPEVPVSQIFVLNSSKDTVKSPTILITSYDLMSKCQNVLLSCNFGVIILDESHSMKNLKSNRTKAALALTAVCKRCILLSGTPALSRPMELYAQIRALDPKSFSSKEFGIRYCAGKEGKFGWDFSGCSNMEELKILLYEKFMIRRLKLNVLDQLPAKIRQVVILDDDLIKSDTKMMSAFEKKLNMENMKATEKRGTLMQYFCETAKTKIAAIKNYICQILETGNKFLVFAHHKDVMEEICNLLEEKKTYYIRIDGKVNAEERKSVCDQFQYEERFKVAVLSITAASTGITLTAANLVIFAELFWNPGILTQAEDRAHRIGQEDSVLVQYLIARNTADDYLWPMIKSKLDILNKAGLSKDNFSCERTTVKTNNKQQSTLFEFFNDLELDKELNEIDLEQIEEIEKKRIKLD